MLIFIVLILSAALIIGLKLSQEYFLRKSYPREYSQYVEFYSEKYDVDPALAYAVIRTESKFQKDIYSKAGAVGLMQIMPETFQDLQKKRGKKQVTDAKILEEPEINIDYGIYFLSHLINKYESEIKAVIAYNAGPSKVDGWLSKKENFQDDGKFNIPYNETKKYVDRVMKAKEVYRKLYFNN
ncbi:MAG: lytic transglycosylase domain-containing protein [Oscillospiraceae bacterium]|nr:lytic transglycosylase domain-containing protein [Oscillospiraceae bacterium]